MMKERPIIFNAEMIQAILAGRKTQTRRVIKPQPKHLSPIRPYHLPNGQWKFVLETGMGDGTSIGFKCPYGQPGSTLWVRETWYPEGNAKAAHEDMLGGSLGDGIYYKATEVSPDIISPWRSPIHMPRWASRITLLVKAIRVERVQEITNQDAWAEGAGHSDNLAPCVDFKDLWNRINNKKGYGWYSNPWVWVVEFERIAQ